MFNFVGIVMKPLNNTIKDVISNELKMAVAQAWRQNQYGVYVLDYDDNKLKRGEPHTLSEEVIESLTSVGLSELFNLKRGSVGHVQTAVMSNGFRLAIRKGFISGAGRSHCPLVLQSYKSWFDAESHWTEIMPAIAMTRNSFLSVPSAQTAKIKLDYDIFDEIGAIFNYLAVNSGYKVLDESCFKERDIALLPNGTPLQIDPDPLDNNEAIDETDNLKAFVELQNSLNLPDELQWIDEQGRRAQDRFFANPFTPK
jgi:hypothetical protein